MKHQLPLPEERKLTVVFRVEPGSLGPNGSDYVEGLCETAQKHFDVIDSGFFRWEIGPRLDKKLPEIEYKINNKKLSNNQAETYLKIFERSKEGFETVLAETIAELINDFLDQ
jgi:hypothetical protein